MGDRIIEDVTGSMTGVEGSSLLLGQSFLSRFHRWSINNSKQVLELGTKRPTEIASEQAGAPHLQMV